MEEHELKRAGSRKKLGIFVVVLVIGIILGVAFLSSAPPTISGVPRLILVTQTPMTAEQRDALADWLGTVSDSVIPPEPELIQLPAEGASEISGELAQRLAGEESLLLLVDPAAWERLQDNAAFDEIPVKYPVDSGVLFRDIPALSGLPPLHICLRLSDRGGNKAEEYGVWRERLEKALGV